MKKISFFVVIVSLLYACASVPQVTVTPVSTPTLTPIPTPTLHPDFIALQESIAASGERFTLNGEDGLVYDGDTPVPGIKVLPDGTLMLTVDGDKEIVIEQDGYSFDDEEGFTVKGMEWDDETGAWVEAMSPAEKQLNVDMEKWNIDLDGADKDKFTKEIAPDGSVTITDNESGEVIYKNGSWDINYLSETLVKNNACKVTPWDAPKIGFAVPSDPKDHSHQYLDPLTTLYKEYVKQGVIPSTGYGRINFYMGNNCWGVVFFEKRGEKQDAAWLFWKDEQGKSQRELVFVDSP